MPATTRANSSAPANPPAPGETSPVALGVSSTPSLQWSADQMDALFAIARQKAEQELQAVTAGARRDEEENAARIAAIREEEETSLGEISPIILSVAGRYPGLPKAEIARSHENRFKPENLYKFRHLKGLEDKDRDENITFEHGQMKIKKVTGTLRDFGNSIEIWSDGFLIYAMVMVDFFGVAFPSLFRSLLMFHSKVRQLSGIYDWQHAVLPFAIDYHTEITMGTHTDVEGWALPQHWVDQYCSPLCVLQNPTTGSRKRAASFALDHANPSKKNGGEIYRNFNTKGCSYKDCSREHKCSNCNAKDHGAHACTGKPKQ
ncbi:hypothetical protein MMC31_008161 [Peltigera leucophlebia]|nr:hypothetical protein [Peltigera leucophlebia]